MKMNYIIATLLLSLLAGCGAQLEELRNIGKPPPMAQVVLPTEKDDYEPLEQTPEEEEQRQYPNSLWQSGSRTFFKDMKARRVGDILKVTVKIKDKAELDNETKRNRDSADSANASTIFGAESKILGMIPGVANPAKLLELGSTTTTNGKGTIARGETIETQVAAMVTQILQNGNLVIHGDQEIRVNTELRKVTVDGIVRPEDISAANSVDSDQIAEARISYGGKGNLSNIQQPRIGNQVIDILSPF
ncbi:MAG: flgH [Rickettsiaceae bacterium]|jgi:flagellar L-ring protein precursor FlgH|nr:flgH [Rickettsiaceae bacterium]